MRFVRRCAFLLPALALLASFACAQDRPTFDFLYNSKDPGSLSYNCNLEGPTLVCRFVQVSVQQKSTALKRAQELERARKNFRPPQSDWDLEWCAGIRSELNRPDPSPGAPLDQLKRSMEEMSPIEKKDTAKAEEANVRFCDNPTEANYLAIVDQELDVEGRTCLINANWHVRRLNQVPGSDAWLVIPEKEGICGVLNVSRFELDRSGKSELAFWKFIAKKVVTNRSGGKIGVGKTCADLDESESEYRWDVRKKKQLSCDYLKFGLLPLR